MRINYNGNLNSKLTHLKSGTEIYTDAPIDNNGLGESFSPTDLTSSSLAACMITIIGIQNEKQNWGITGMEAEIEKIMSTDSPRRISKIIVDLNISSEDKSEIFLNKLRMYAEKCPVALSLHPDIQQKIFVKFT